MNEVSQVQVLVGWVGPTQDAEVRLWPLAQDGDIFDVVPDRDLDFMQAQVMMNGLLEIPILTLITAFSVTTIPTCIISHLK